MAPNTSIEWTQCTWNPLTGCTKVSPGCKHCYAERMSRRLQAMGQLNYIDGFNLTMHEHMLRLPLQWKKPRTIFVNSMSDIFHEKVPVEFILRVFDIMEQADWHHFQILTKRSHRLAELSPILPWLPNIWMGVSVENKDYTFRIDHLRNTGAKIKFLSIEPLLGPLQGLNIEGIDWVILGGESGPKSRIINKTWVIDIRNQCRKAKIPFFFKQWGGINKKMNGRELEGRTWDEMPLPVATAGLRNDEIQSSL